MGGRDRLDPRRGEAVAGRLLTGMFDSDLKAGSIHNFPFGFKKEPRPFWNDERGGGRCWVNWGRGVNIGKVTVGTVEKIR